jgi:hypothetical protein
MKKLKLKEELPSRKRLVKLLDDEWRVAVRKFWATLIGSNVCPVPGCKNSCRDPHHIFSRKRQSTR